MIRERQKSGKSGKQNQVQLNATWTCLILMYLTCKFFKTPLIPRGTQQPMYCSLEVKPEKALPALGFDE